MGTTPTPTPDLVTRHSWRSLKGLTMRCARRRCRALRRPGGQKYQYRVSGPASEWTSALVPCTGEPTSDR